MRFVNIASALTGAGSLIILGVAHHFRGDDPDFRLVTFAGLAQLSAAATGLALASRSGRLNTIGAAMILIGANLFATIMYLGAFNVERPFLLAPIGAAILILGWIVLAFAKPRD